jgi:hypothetical protein
MASIILSAQEAVDSFLRTDGLGIAEPTGQEEALPLMS